MWRKKLVNLIILIIGLFLIVNLTRSIWELLGVGDRINEAEEQVAQLKFKNDELKKQLSQVQSPEFLEKMAREKLGLAKEGEVVVILPANILGSSESAEKKEWNLPNWQKWWNLFF